MLRLGNRTQLISGEELLDSCFMNWRAPLGNLLSEWQTVQQGSRQLWHHTETRVVELLLCSKATLHRADSLWWPIGSDIATNWLETFGWDSHKTITENHICITMDMLNKLKDNFTSYASSAVTNTVYSTGNIISGVLPGNPVTRWNDQISRGKVSHLTCFRDFEVTAHIASAGPGLLWKVKFSPILPQICLQVYSAVKKSTKQAASVFVLERALLDRLDQ